MAKLASRNLSRRQSNRIVEFLYHSHRSVKRRTRFANEFVAPDRAKGASRANA